jgi:beta-phosphoglucomutase-like phosphatase (HAD superfamily)
MRTRERRPDLYEIFCKSQEEEGNRARTKKKLKAVILRLETCLCRDSVGELCLKPFLRELLGLVREQGLKLGLVSLMESEQAQKLLESEGVSQLFDYICLGADEETLYNRAARKSSTARRETFVFEDTVSGIQAARACGLRVVLLKEEEPGKEYADLICYKRISDLVEGMALIRSLS